MPANNNMSIADIFRTSRNLVNQRRAMSNPRAGYRSALGRSDRYGDLAHAHPIPVAGQNNKKPKRSMDLLEFAAEVADRASRTLLLGGSSYGNVRSFDYFMTAGGGGGGGLPTGASRIIRGGVSNRGFTRGQLVINSAASSGWSALSASHAMLMSQRVGRLLSRPEAVENEEPTGFLAFARGLTAAQVAANRLKDPTAPLTTLMGLNKYYEGIARRFYSPRPAEYRLDDKISQWVSDDFIRRKIPNKTRHVSRHSQVAAVHGHYDMNRVIKSAIRKYETDPLAAMYSLIGSGRLRLVRNLQLKHSGLTEIVDAFVKRKDKLVKQDIPYSSISCVTGIGKISLRCQVDDLLLLHDLRVCADDPALVEYTASLKDLIAGKRVSIRPGRYFNKFFGPDSELNVLGANSVKATTELHNGLYGPVEIKFAKTSEDIVRVIAEGPSSCMSNSYHRDSSDDYSWFDGQVHPAAAYNEEDVEVLYITHGGDITARAIANKKTKALARIYGDVSRLRPAAEKLGYTVQNDALVGVRLKKIRSTTNPNQVIMAYVDGGEKSGMLYSLWLKDMGDYWLLQSEEFGSDARTSNESRGTMYYPKSREEKAALSREQVVGINSNNADEDGSVSIGLTDVSEISNRAHA